MRFNLLKKFCLLFVITILIVLLTNFINNLFQSETNVSVDSFELNVDSILCTDLFNNRSNALQRASTILSNRRSRSLVRPDRDFIFSANYCRTYLSNRFNEKFHWNDTSMNREFPIAFTILLHENVEQFERLLRLIYRRQNFYCVHIDVDASKDVFQAIQSISQCFDNVFISSQLERVIYASFSRLQADINCMSDLIQYPSWKYLLNIVNSELPLRTNSELVKILSIYRGFNDIEGRWKTRIPKRTNFVWELANPKEKSYRNQLKATDIRKSPPPGDLEIVKGSAYGAFSRSFVEFILIDPIAKEFLNWSRDTYSPDEHYWSTLNYNLHIHAPGGYQAKTDPTEWTARFVNWGEYRCHGRKQRSICIFGFADLPLLSSRRELIANKFQLTIDPIAYQCQEEQILRRSRNDPDAHSIDLSLYEQIPFLVD